MIRLTDYIQQFPIIFPEHLEDLPWVIVATIESLILKRIKTLGPEYTIDNNIAIHKNARVEQHVILKGPMIVADGCFIGSHAYLRGGVFLGEKTSIGPGCEIKSSFILGGALAHFNFVGDSILGKGVNMEAGSIIANHFNERTDKSIYVSVKNDRLLTGVEKFGALVGDNTKIGANAVLSPGTVLSPDSVVKRLELIDQNPINNSSREYHF
jgi:bifunctional N-acetylglucosamine-1-phosphate-uridyltransferase/glucosamine-1-phosphate-acetyltransferase GlmU-like protein